MAEMRFAWFPVTVERPERRTGQVLIVNEAFYDPATGEATIGDDYEAHEYTAAVVDLLSDTEFRFRTETGEPFILRETRPADATTTRGSPCGSTCPSTSSERS